MRTVSKISSFWKYAVSRWGTELLESSFCSTLCLLKDAMLIEDGQNPHQPAPFT